MTERKSERVELEGGGHAIMLEGEGGWVEITEYDAEGNFVRSTVGYSGPADYDSDAKCPRCFSRGASEWTDADPPPLYPVAPARVLTCKACGHTWVECPACRAGVVHWEERDAVAQGSVPPPPESYGTWAVCDSCGAEWKEPVFGGAEMRPGGGRQITA